MLQLLGAPCWHGSTPSPARYGIAPIDALVLCMLALNGPCERKVMALRLWPGKSEAAATRNLRQHIFQIRRVAGDAAIVGDGVIALSPDTPVDVHQAPELLAADAQAMQGELLQGVLAPSDEVQNWLDEERARWFHRLALAIAELAGRAAAAGRWDEALPYAERLVAQWPDDETHYHRLMQLHYLQGHLGAAMEVFRRCEETLWREDERRPGTDLRTLASTIAAAASLVSPAPGRPPVPMQMLRPAALVARDAEWQRLEGAWQSEQALILSGEPGMGKSRLVGDFAVAREALLVTARPGDASVPYGVAARMLAALHARCGAPDAVWAREEAGRIAPWVGAVPIGPTHRPRLHAALKEWLTAAWQRGLQGVVVDDLQYADEASLEVLLDAAAEGAGHWLFAVRAAEWPALLRDRAADAPCGGIQVLHLRPLTHDGVARLLEAAGVQGETARRWANAYSRLCGGNPYFVLQTLIGVHTQGQPSLDSALPMVAQLLELMARRFDKLSPMARRLAEVLAVAGEDFSSEMAAQVMHQPVIALGDAWRELERACLLQGEGFAHDLAREAVQRLMPQPIAMALHWQVAAQGEAFAMPPARQAEHWLAAGDEARAVVAFMAAATEAASLARRREQAQWLDRALACLERVGDWRHQFEALLQRVRVARFVSPYDDELRFARALVGAARGEAQRGEALAALSSVLTAGGHLAEAESPGKEALALADRVGDVGLRRRAAMALANVLVATNREDEGIALCLGQLPAAQQAGDAATVELLVDLGHHLARAGRVGEALPLLRRARSIAQGTHDWGVLAEVLGLLGYLQHIRANVARAAVLCVRGLHYQRMTGPMATSQLKGHIDVPRLYRELGRYTQSLALLDELRSGQAKDREYRLSTLGDADLSFIWLQLGQPEKALQALRSADRPPSGAYAPSWLVARARIEHWAGRPADALLRDCFEQVNGENRVLRWLAGRDLALSLPPEEGAALAEQLVSECSAVDSPITLWPLHVAWCDRLLAAGDVRGAAATARRVLATMGRRIMPSLYHPHAWWIVSKALHAAHADDEAQQAQVCGLRWIERALPHVPPSYRQSFLHANPFNVGLLQHSRDGVGQGSGLAITAA